jgi:hypothetical protein
VVNLIVAASHHYFAHIQSARVTSAERYAPDKNRTCARGLGNRLQRSFCAAPGAGTVRARTSCDLISGPTEPAIDLTATSPLAFGRQIAGLY